MEVENTRENQRLQALTWTLVCAPGVIYTGAADLSLYYSGPNLQTYYDIYSAMRYKGTDFFDWWSCSKW